MIQFLLNNARLIDVVAKLAGIATLIGLLFAFRQYRHSVRVAQRTERRAAVELAAKECTHYGLNILRSVNELLDQINKSGCDYLNHCKITPSEKGLAVDTSAVTPDDGEKIKSHIKQIVEVLNGLEGFAIPFAEGVADNRVGFIECGRSFVQTTERMAPLYSFWPLKDYYQSSQTIYMRWKREIGQEERDRRFVQAGKDFMVMSAQIIKDRSKSRFWRAVADWCEKRAKD